MRGVAQEHPGASSVIGKDDHEAFNFSVVALRRRDFAFEGIAGVGIVYSYFFCRLFKASSNNSLIRFPLVRRSSTARLSISASRVAGRRTLTPTDSGSFASCFLAMITRTTP
jgi:hypothetical protein